MSEYLREDDPVILCPKCGTEKVLTTKNGSIIAECPLCKTLEKKEE